MRPFVHGHVGDAQADAHRRWWLESYDQPHDASAVSVDRDGQVRAADLFALLLVDDDQINVSLIDLEVQRLDRTALPRLIAGGDVLVDQRLDRFQKARTTAPTTRDRRQEIGGKNRFIVMALH
jgi:hypothetical protein